LKQRKNTSFDGAYEHFAISCPLESFARPQFQTVIINKVKDISPFIREIIYKAQLFINYYVLHKCIDDIPNLIFTKFLVFSLQGHIWIHITGSTSTALSYSFRSQWRFLSVFKSTSYMFETAWPNYELQWHVIRSV
jgi:hypothetical protein